MRRAVASIWLCLLAWCLAPAQTSVTGRVTDTDGEALAGAIIKILNATDRKAVKAYGSCNAQGVFSISVRQPGDSILITAAALGYVKGEKVFRAPYGACDMVLEHSTEKLREVVVKAPAIRSQGDTITFDVASFRSKTDRNIEAVIGRLPGVSIEANGALSYQGKTINKFYIEGLSMLGGRYSVATRNISPDDVASVSVYENHQPKKVLEGIEVSDRAALNLKLKKSSMLRPVGYVEGGGGGVTADGASWMGELFAFTAGSGGQWMVTLKGNEAGTTYANELTDHSGNTGKASTFASGLFPMQLFGRPQLAASRYADNLSWMASANGILKLANNTTLTTNIRWARDDNRYSNACVTTYTGLDQAGSSMTIEENNRSDLSSQQAGVDFNVERNSNNVYLKETLTLDGDFHEAQHNLRRQINIVGQQQRTDNYSVTNKLQAIWRRGYRAWEINSTIGLANTPVNRMVACDEEAYTLIAAQKATGLALRTDTWSSLSMRLRAGHSAGVKLKFTADYDRLDLLRPASGESADAWGYRIITAIEPNYGYTLDRVHFGINLPVRLYNMRYASHEGNSPLRYDRPHFGPTLAVTYRSPFLMVATAKVGRTHSVGGFSDFITIPVMTTYRTERTPGTGAIGTRRSDAVTLSVDYRHPLHDFFGSMSVSVRSNKSNTMSRSVISEEMASTSSALVTSRTKTVDGNLMLSKHVRYISTTFKLMAYAGSSHGETERNGRVMGVRSMSLSVAPSLSGQWLDDVLSADLSAKYELSRQRVGEGLPYTSLTNVEVKGEVGVSPWEWGQMFVTPSFTQHDLGDGRVKRDMFLDAGVRFTVGKWQLGVSLKNLTDRKSYTLTRFASDNTYVTTYMLRRREFMATARYKF